MIQAGPLVDIHIPRDKSTGQHRGFGFAEYETEESAIYAVHLFTGTVCLFNRMPRFQVSVNERMFPAQTSSCNVMSRIHLIRRSFSCADFHIRKIKSQHVDGIPCLAQSDI